MTTNKTASIFLLLELKKTKGKFCGNCGYKGRIRLQQRSVFRYKKICWMFDKEIKIEKKTMEYIRCKKCRSIELK